MNPHMGSPVQKFQQGNGISPSPQMTRMIPSQGNNRYMQQPMQPQQQPQQQNMSSMSPSINNPHDNKEVHTPKSYNTTMSGYVQQSPMQTHASPIPRQSATPGSTHSTPHQQYQQLDTITPHMSPSINNNNNINQPSPSPKPSESMETNQESSTTPQQKVTYIPKTRNVDTYGGVDLKYFDKFEIKPPVPHITELGLVDIQALTLSLKSGLKMEISNALNILTVLTVSQSPMQHPQQQPMSTLPLQHCDELLDVLLDLLEQDILGTCKRFAREDDNGATNFNKSDISYTNLFDMSLDEMKSLIPELETSSSDQWLSLRDRCLCILNILRNLTFMVENVQHLAKHTRFIDLIADIVDETRDDAIQKQAWYVGIRYMDRLDFRKSILMMFANLSMLVELRTPKNAAILVSLVHDFMVNGPDTYYSLLAIETWTKLTVNHDNRQLLHALMTKDPNMAESITDIWLELANLIQRDFFSYDGRVMHAMTSNQLATLEQTVIGLYNVMAIAQSESLKQDLAQRNRSLGMMIVRLSITLAESGNAQFGVVTKRGMELIRAMVCGGDGIRRRQPQRNQPGPFEVLGKPQAQPEDERDHKSPSEIGHLILDVPMIKEKLMLSLLKPTTDPEILRELSDIVTSIDEDIIKK